MTDTVYVLIGADQYYPPPDGTIAVFADESEANAVLDEIQEATHWKADEGAWDELCEKYEYLPDFGYESFFITEHELADGSM